MAERTKALPVQLTPINAPIGGPGIQILDFSNQRVSLLVRSVGLDAIYVGFDPQAGANEFTRAQVFRLDPGDAWSPDSPLGTHQGQLWGWGGYGALTKQAAGLVEVEQLVVDPSAPNPEQSGLELPPDPPTVPPEPPTPWQPAPPAAPWHDLTRRL